MLELYAGTPGQLELYAGVSTPPPTRAYSIINSHMHPKGTDPYPGMHWQSLSACDLAGETEFSGHGEHDVPVKSPY